MKNMNFENIEYRQEKIVTKFEDLIRKDLSKKDLSSCSADLLKTTDFDTETLWPDKDKLPREFNPEVFLEESKNPGLGVQELHRQGINGDGVIVAIIDQKLDINHQEYKDSIINYTEYDKAKDESISMHGPAVASLLTGKDCGVAPDAKLVYKAVPSDRNFLFYSQALEDIIRDNESVPQNKQVRVVSCSIGYMEDGSEPGIKEWIASLKKAKEHGIFVIDAEGEQVGVSFVGGGSLENKNDFESYVSWSKKDDMDDDLKKLVSEKNTFGVLKRLREINGTEFSNISDSDLIEKIEKYFNEIKKEIIVPSDYRTMASSLRKEGQYMYNGKGGISWSVPYLAGLFALALQINPDISQEELSEIIDKSALTNTKGLRIINPKGIIQLVKETMNV